MRPDPKLGVRTVRVDLVYNSGLQSVSGDAAVESPYAPGVILDGRAEWQDRFSVVTRVGGEGGHGGRSGQDDVGRRRRRRRRRRVDLGGGRRRRRVGEGGGGVVFSREGNGGDRLL